LRWASVVFLLIAVIVAAFSSGSDFDKLLAAFFAMQRSLEIVQGGLWFLVFVLSSSLGLRWKQHTRGMALELAIFTSVNLAAFTLRAQFGMLSQDTLSVISSAGFDCAVLTWLLTVYPSKILISPNTISSIAYNPGTWIPGTVRSSICSGVNLQVTPL
jgi:hypothetical protein